MFIRVKKSGANEYLQIVENQWSDGGTSQRVIGTIGRVDRLKEKGSVDQILRPLAKYSDKALLLLLLAGTSDPDAIVSKIGTSIIFECLWDRTGIKEVLTNLLEDYKHSFDVDRAVFLTVLHRLFCSGSDRQADRWKDGYRIEGAEDIKLHQIYRAMAWLGNPLKHDEQEGATPFSPRRTKDLIEERLFERNRNLFTELNLVFMDTTSIYFEGEGKETIWPIRAFKRQPSGFEADGSGSGA